MLGANQNRVVQSNTVDQGTVQALAVVAIVLLVALVALGFWLTRRSRRRPPVPPDLRRADEAEATYDERRAVEAAEAEITARWPRP